MINRKVFYHICIYVHQFRQLSRVFDCECVLGSEESSSVTLAEVRSVPSQPLGGRQQTAVQIEVDSVKAVQDPSLQFGD